MQPITKPLHNALTGWLSLVRAPPQRTEPSAAIVVLGAAVRPDGTPSEALRRRAECGAALWHRNTENQLVITGGIVTYPPAESIVGARVAVAHGVPQRVIVHESRATSTVENALFTRAIIGDVPVIVVTDDFHAARAGVVFSRVFSRVQVVACRSKHRWRRVPRELLATLYALVRRIQ